MAFDWRGYFVLANDLKKNPAEGAQRASLGRSYYYVYNLGLEVARTLKFTGKPPSLHRQLWEWCRQQGNSDIQTLGNLGNRMKSFRVDADYDAAPIANLSGEVQRQLTRARQFEVLIAKVTKTNAPPPLP